MTEFFDALLELVSNWMYRRIFGENFRCESRSANYRPETRESK